MNPNITAPLNAPTEFFRMRVITGIARGRRLVTPEGDDVRPTTDKVKEAIFSAVQFRLEDAYVLDLFAGSGQMGIEALSRGAKRAIFVDNSRKSLNCINENLHNTKLDKFSEVISRDSFDYIRLTARRFDIIILDPPYRHGYINELLPLAADKLLPGGCIICEYEADADVPDAPENTFLKKTYKYGRINVSIYFRNEDEESE